MVTRYPSVKHSTSTTASDLAGEAVGGSEHLGCGWYRALSRAQWMLGPRGEKLRRHGSLQAGMGPDLGLGSGA